MQRRIIQLAPPRRSIYIKKRGIIFEWKKTDVESTVLKILKDNVSCSPEKVSMYASTNWDLLMNHREQYDDFTSKCIVLDSSGISKKFFNLISLKHKLCVALLKRQERPWNLSLLI